jgi:hypothetical protein
VEDADALHVPIADSVLKKRRSDFELDLFAE